MQSSNENIQAGPLAGDRSPLSAAERRTLAAIFRHPLQHNLEWTDVVALVERLGRVEPKANSTFAFRIGPETQIMHKPHSKDLATAEMLDLRHFLVRAGQSPEMNLPAQADPDRAAASSLVVVDHRGTRLYHLDVSSAHASAHVIRPYDPHHFLHHMKHKDQSRERGQKPAEDTSYYVRIAAALVAGGPIVVVGHGQGDSNAAHHLTEYLRAHHDEIHARIVAQISADLSSLTDPQLLALGAQALQRSREPAH